MKRLEARLASLPVIEQAKGILMARQGCDPDEAFDVLRRASHRKNLKVRELAKEIVAANRLQHGRIDRQLPSSDPSTNGARKSTRSEGPGSFSAS
jgi:hypothetical protein